MFRTIFSISILMSFTMGISAWAKPNFLGTYYRFSDGKQASLNIFEIYELTLPDFAVKSLMAQRDVEVLPVADPRFGFVSKGSPLPKKVYFVDRASIEEGASTNEIADNVLPLIWVNEEGVSSGIKKSQIGLHKALQWSEASHEERIRVSCAALVRIQDSAGNLILLANKSIYNNGRSANGVTLPAGTIMKAAIGGALGVIPDFMNQIGNTGNFLTEAEVKFERPTDRSGQTDLRFTMVRNALPEFIDWFSKREGRETDPNRELEEELVQENRLFSREEWNELINGL